MLVLPVVIAAAACSPSVPVTAPSSPPGSASAQPSPTATAGAPSAASGPAGSGATAAVLRVDATLLRVLPTQVDGAALVADPTTAGQIAGDPTLASSAEAIAVALAIQPGTSAGDDLAIASVIRLRPGVFSDAWFENWRTTYDQSACEVAGGVTGEPSQVSIGGRVVFVGTCAGDARTYHVHLPGPSLIVSVTAAGRRHFGDLVIAGLTE
jgi:hypothetical protein